MASSVVLVSRLAVGTVIRALLLAYFALGLCFPALAQEFSRLDDIDVLGTSYHRFVRPGEPTVELMILGNAAASGVYVVGAETGYAELFALSGAMAGGESGRERTRVHVRLYRDEAGQRRLITDSTVEDLIAAPRNYSTFEDGDIVYIEARSRTRFSWLELLRSASSIATLVFVVERVVTAVR